MKNTVSFGCLFLLITIFNSIFAQESLTMIKLKEMELKFQTRMDSIADNLKSKTISDSILLMKRTQNIEMRYQKMKSKLRKRDSIDYYKIYNSATQILMKGLAIGAVVNITKEDDLVKQTIKNIGDKRSPTNDSFGKSFIDIITEQAKNMFSASRFKNPDNAKNIWNSIVDKIVNNDIINVVLKSNPITSTISSIITSAAFFIDNDLKLKNNQKVKEVFIRDEIIKFQNRLKPFLTYYYELDEASRIYDLDKEQFDITFENFTISSKTLYLDFMTATGCKESKEELDCFNKLFKRNKGNNIPYGSVLAKEEITKISKYTSNWNIILLQFKSYLVERDDIVIDYLNNTEKLLNGYITDIKEVKSENKYNAMFDLAKVKEFIVQIDETKKKIITRRDNLNKSKDVMDGLVNYKEQLQKSKAKK